MDSGPLFQRRKRKVYVSYNHFRDADRFEAFRRAFSSLYEIARDNSLDRELGPDDAQSYLRRLRDEAIADAGTVLVLCGAATAEDRYVDWEIQAALDRGAGLIGILFPELPAGPDDRAGWPDRLARNFDKGYAVICRWQDLLRDKIELSPRIDYAMERPLDLIDNSLPLRS
jgi:hypothetical protein